MKFVDKIIADIPKLDIEKEDSKYKDELKYLADSRVILDNLREYEVDIPKEYVEKHKDKWFDYDNGVLEYMSYITNTKIDDFKGGNTYNYNGKILHDLNYDYVETDNGFYIAIMVHRFGDVRGNYTDRALFKFDYYEEFFEVIDNICMENFGGCVKYNDKHYFYDISIFDEFLRVWCKETQDNYDFYAYNDESFIEEIKKCEKK